MIRINDNAHLLTTQDVELLQKVAGNWPFDAAITTSFDSMSRSAFENLVSQTIPDANGVAIGIHPNLHMTTFRVGSSTGISPNRWHDIAVAGDPAFRLQHWREGVEAIGASATQARAASAVIASTEAPQPPPSAHTGVFIMGILGAVVLAIGVVSYIFWRKAKKDAKKLHDHLEALDAETSEKRSRNIEEQAWHEKLAVSMASPNTPTPVAVRPTAFRPMENARTAPLQHTTTSSTVVNNYGNSNNGSDFTTGLLIGSTLGQPHYERETIIRERPESTRERIAPRVVEEDRPTYSPSSSDSGGSSSSWDSGSSSSSDSGGSSSSYDSGSSSSYDSGGSSDGGGSSSSWD